MKNFIATLFSALLLVCSLLFALPSQAAGSQVKVVVNGAEVQFPDAQPYINSVFRTMVPIRFISASLGYNVTWDGIRQKVTIDNGKKKIELTVGDHQAIVAGKPVYLDAPVTISGQRTFVPVRFISEAFGQTVTWREWNHTVYVGTVPTDRVINMVATAYGNESGQYDYCGNKLQPGTVAVDPSVIPLGTHLYIEGYSFSGLPSEGMYGVASDVGGKIKGNRIDIYIPKNAMAFGMQNVKVHVLD